VLGPTPASTIRIGGDGSRGSAGLCIRLLHARAGNRWALEGAGARDCWTLLAISGCDGTVATKLKAGAPAIGRT
jgi:hypothetical protein